MWFSHKSLILEKNILIKNTSNKSTIKHTHNFNFMEY